MAWPPAGTTETQTANGWQLVIPQAAAGTYAWPTIAANGFQIVLTQVLVIGDGGGTAASGTLDTTGVSGGGGAACSISAASLPGTAETGSFTANIPATSAGAAGGDVWFNRTTNASPGSPSAGALAKGGGLGAANGGAAGVGGAAASGIGDTKFSGGIGGTGALGAGGGGGGAAGQTGSGGNASGTSGGTGNSPGANGSGNNAAGPAPGGGAGGAGGLGGSALAGGAGEVVLIYDKRYSGSTSESLTTSDAVTRRAVQGRLPSDSNTIAETLTRLAAYTKQVSDTLTNSETATRQVVFKRNPADTVLAADTPTRQANFGRKPTEPLTLSDAISRVLNYGRFPQDGGDWVVRNPTKAIAGVTRDQAGNPLGGCTVLLFREVDNYCCQQTTSDGSGNYSFSRDLFDPYLYYVLSYKPGSSPQVHGVSDRDIAPA